MEYTFYLVLKFWWYQFKSDFRSMYPTCIFSFYQTFDVLKINYFAIAVATTKM